MIHPFLQSPDGGCPSFARRVVRRPSLLLLLSCWLAVAVAPTATAGSTPTVIDDGANASAWSALASPSAKARIVRAAPDASRVTALGLDYDLGRGRAWVTARRDLDVGLPEDWTLVLRVKAEAEVNTVEIKLVSGDNVWWRRLQDIELPRDWREWRVPKSRLSFAWGSDAAAPLAHVDSIEIAVVAGRGGAGRLWIDEVRIEPRRPEADALPPLVTSTSGAGSAAAVLDADPASAWTPDRDDREPALVLDFHEPVEQGGLVVRQHASMLDQHASMLDQRASSDGRRASPRPVRNWVVESSLDARTWREERRFTSADGGREDVFLPDTWARYLRLRFFPARGEEVAIASVEPQPFAYSESVNGFFTAIARSGEAGLYPRYFTGEQSYWAAVGVDGGQHEALVNEEGSVEVDAGAFTLEPFVFDRGRLRTWKDASSTVSLADGDLPIPTVTRRDGDLTFEVTAFADGEPDASTLVLRYRLGLDASVSAQGHKQEKGRELRLFVAARPFQVLPPWQALGRTGGVAKVSKVVGSRRGATIDSKRIVPLTKASAFGAAAFEEGDVTAFLSRGEVPPSGEVDDPFGAASAAFAFDLELEPGGTRDVWIAAPWDDASPVPLRDAPARLESVRAAWRKSLDRVGIELPPRARELADSLRSNLAWILVNRDGAAIQPGSRTYERSWIRDGSMTSLALLELGFFEEARAFVRWYAPWVGEDGIVPCCVDAKGADPVPENDSHGQFVWAVADVWRYTRDEAFVRELWPKARAAAEAIVRLRATRMTEAWRGEDKRAYFGLLPESISHEGYSARPVHAYWDQVFALRGLKDAAMLARVAGDAAAASRFAAQADAFAGDLAASVREVMRRSGMELLPASVELADFDPTSTAVAWLLGVEDVYPPGGVEKSFDRYLSDLRARRGDSRRGIGYTAYELRNATALLRIGREAEAVALLEELAADQRPSAWNQWPEISWLKKDEGAFLGDLPHTWIGSTFVHAVRRLLVVEREAGDSLLVGAGIPLDWLEDGGEVRGRGLPTWHGALTMRVRREGVAGEARVVVELEGDLRVPAGGIEVAAPFGAVPAGSLVREGPAAEAVPATLGTGGRVTVRRLPATVVFDYKDGLENPS